MGSVQTSQVHQTHFVCSPRLKTPVEPASDSLIAGALLPTAKTSASASTLLSTNEARTASRLVHSALPLADSFIYA